MSSLLASRDDPDGMHDTRNVSQDRQQDVYPEVQAKANLKEDATGGKMMARMIRMMSISIPR